MMAKIQITTTIKNSNFLILNGELKTERCSEALPSSTSNNLKFKTSHFSQLIEKYVWKKTPWYRTKACLRFNHFLSWNKIKEEVVTCTMPKRSNTKLQFRDQHWVISCDIQLDWMANVILPWIFSHNLRSDGSWKVS